LIQEFSLSSLLPDTEEFITYEGSLTQPPCQVGVLNSPLGRLKQPTYTVAPGETELFYRSVRDTKPVPMVVEETETAHMAIRGTESLNQSTQPSGD
jgi:hypothetical protein